MPEQKETVVCNFNARKFAELGGIIRNRLQEKTGTKDFKKLNLGFEVPDNYLSISGPQPTLAELTVLAAKLGLQLRLSAVDLVTTEQIEADNAAAAKAGK